MRVERFEVDTSESFVSDLTSEVERFARDAASGGDGLVHAFVPHATCGLALMETGSGSEEDLRVAVERLLPREDRYRHRHGSIGHGGDHLLPVFVSPSLALPVEAGSLSLGRWQRVVLVDPNRENNRRRVELRFLAG